MNYKEHLNEAYDYFKSKHPDWDCEKLEYWSEQAATRLLKEEQNARKFN